MTLKVHIVPYTTDIFRSCNNNFSFIVQVDFKQSRPGNNILHVNLPAFASDPRICIVRTLSTYLDRTRSKSSKLFVSTIEPHGPVSKDTILRWNKALMSCRTGVMWAHIPAGSC